LSIESHFLKVLDRSLLRLSPAFRDRNVGENHRRARLVAPGGGEGVEPVDVGRGLGPFVLHDHQHGKAKLSHDLDGFRADGGAEETPFRMRYRPRPDRGAWNPVVLAVEAETVPGQRHLDDLRRLDEARPCLALVDAEAFILHAGGAAAEAEHRAPAGDDVEQRDLLRHPDRVMPRQDDHRRAEGDPLRPAG